MTKPFPTQQALEQLELVFGSEFPTDRAPQRAQAAALVAAQQRAAREEAHWCDSEAPTGVAAERPLFPRPPRAPRV